MVDIPEVILTIGSRAMPLVGMGTAAHPFTPENTKRAIIDAIEIGYRHFDTASLYGSEEPLGEAIMEAQKLGLIKSRDELFITSKLWCHEAHPHLVLPAINKSLRNLKMEYLDLYLIHMPISSKPEPGKFPFPVDKDDIVPMDMKSVWEAMEECRRLGLTRAIGVSNFTEKKLDLLLATAKIPPQVNQVEMNPTWQQIKLREYCKEKGIHVTAYSPLGGQIADKNLVMESEVMKEIANSQGKTVAQVSLRWIHEQGVSMVVKSFNKERIKKNLEIFSWELTKEEQHKISQIPQCKKVNIELVVSNRGTWKPHPDDEL